MKINFATALCNPIHARDQTGRLVTLIALGDLEGMSPGYLFVGGDGVSKWAPIDKFVIVDPLYLPVENEAVTRR